MKWNEIRSITGLKLLTVSTISHVFVTRGYLIWVMIIAKAIVQRHGSLVFEALDLIIVDQLLRLASPGM